MDGRSAPKGYVGNIYGVDISRAQDRIVRAEERIIDKQKLLNERFQMKVDSMEYGLDSSFFRQEYETKQEVEIPEIPWDTEALRKLMNSRSQTVIQKPRNYGKSTFNEMYRRVQQILKEEPIMSNSINSTDAKAIRNLNSKLLALYKLGVVDEDGDLTDAGTTLIWDILIETNHDALVAAATEIRDINAAPAAPVTATEVAQA